MSPNAESRPDDGPRQLSEPRLLRALAHPVRLALIELLTVEGPRTATEAAEHLGESPSNCSFHLRQLAKFGFVEEAGDGRGRRRPWRMAQIGTTYVDTAQDPDLSVAGEAFRQMVDERWWARWRRWRQTAHTFPAPWRDAGGSSETVWWVTPEELRSMEDEVLALTMRWRERLQEPAARPAGSQPVEFVALVFPFRPPTSDGG